MKVQLVALGLACISVSASSTSGDMKISTFLQKADALKEKGMLALASSDVSLLKSEGKAAGEAYRARIASDKANKRSPHSCPPAKAALKSDDLIAHFRTYSAAQRQQVTVRTGFADMMQKRYPCKS